MDHILLAHGLPKETISFIMVLYNAMVFSPNGDANFFTIVAGVLQKDTSAPNNQPRLRTMNFNCSNKRKWFQIFFFKKTWCRRYHVENMTDADIEEDLARLANTPAQAESQQQRHFHFKWQTSEIRIPVHIPRQQYLIYWNWCHQTLR